MVASLLLQSYVTALAARRGVGICDQNGPADTKVCEKERGCAALGTGAEIPLQPMYALSS